MVWPLLSLQVHLLGRLLLPLLPQTPAAPNLQSAEHLSLPDASRLSALFTPPDWNALPPFGPTANTPLSRVNASLGSLDPQGGMTTSPLEPQLNPTESVETPIVTHAFSPNIPHQPSSYYYIFLEDRKTSLVFLVHQLLTQFLIHVT